MINTLFPGARWTRLLVWVALGSFGATGRAEDIPDFNRDIRPILSEKCFRCHGPDEHERKGGDHGVRLDTAYGAIEDLGGYQAIAPGNPEKSEVLIRVTTTDDEEVMPPRKASKPLIPSEVELLRRWIAGGAPYAQHWAYEKPRRAALPTVKNEAWARGAIDRFVLARLEKAGLPPQPEADRSALARRVALDLTGVPPSLSETQAFQQDSRADAYERYVDRQFAKPAYGEHWARSWLDLARYADSKGYANDTPRSIWRYRDYVVDALNRNMPFDQFTIEQLAGDLLPDPTPDQRFATGFHRNTMNNTEGGTDNEEFRSVAVVDRVNTTMAVWMGSSLACAQCHTHKYDPFTQKEYFQLYAIFNQSEDADRDNDAPLLEFYPSDQEALRAPLLAEIARIDQRLRESRPRHADAARTWAAVFPTSIEWQSARPHAVKSSADAVTRTEDDGRIFVEPGKRGDNTVVEMSVPSETPVSAIRLETLPHPELPGHGAGGAAGNFVLSRFRVGIKLPDPLPRARYVRIELPGKEQTLQLAEVEVFSGGKNIAATGVATQSSIRQEAGASRAIDGRTDGDAANQSVSQTAISDNPWWELDLRSLHPLERVKIWARTGTEPSPGGLTVTVLDETRSVVRDQISRAAPGPSRTFDLSTPRDLKMSFVVVDYSPSDYDEYFTISDSDPKPPSRRKRSATTKGWSADGSIEEAHTFIVVPESPIVLGPGERLVVTLEQQSQAIENATLNHFRLSTTHEPRVADFLRAPPTVIQALRSLEAQGTGMPAESLIDYYVRTAANETLVERERIASLQRTLDDMPVNFSPVFSELPLSKHRPTFVQLRGNFRSLGEEVSAGVPAVFPPIADGEPVNRLTFARWLVSADNPMTARVLANRLWESIFGIGLVRTTEEFGSQGELPSHPELLDWLALELVAGKWDTQRFIRMLVTSAAYRQGSRVTVDALAIDPENRLLSRGPRFRLSAEMIRDQALEVSGLLDRRLHGPPVRPFQPAFGLTAAFGSTLDWKVSAGADRYRRGLYTEWRRSSPYPSMVTFDAPNREVCTLRRDRSNTPLQALVTLNDPVFVEAAQSLAKLMAADAMQSRDASLRLSVEDGIRHGFSRVLLRRPTDAEVSLLQTLYDNSLADYTQSPDQAAALIAGWEKCHLVASERAPLAAWTTVANVLLNLDETLMKR